MEKTRQRMEKWRIWRFFSADCLRVSKLMHNFVMFKRGSVAQLNRASDSGSAGHGFESHPGHIIFFFIFYARRCSGGNKLIPVSLFDVMSSRVFFLLEDRIMETIGAIDAIDAKLA